MRKFTQIAAGSKTKIMSFKGIQDFPNIHFQWVLWENSRHFVTLPLVSPQNDVRETSAEIPYWWRVSTQIWVVLLLKQSSIQLEALPRSVKPLYSSFWPSFRGMPVALPR